MSTSASRITSLLEWHTERRNHGRRSPAWESAARLSTTSGNFRPEGSGPDRGL